MKIKRFLMVIVVIFILAGTYGTTNVKAATSTPGDAEPEVAAVTAKADGIYTNNDGNPLCCIDGEYVKNGWYLITNPVEGLGSGQVSISGNVYYYVNANGYVTYKALLNESGAASYVYSWNGSSWTMIKSNLFRLYDGKAHYINANGINVTTAGWYKYNATTHIYVCAAGYVTGMLQTNGVVWRYYIYDYTGGKWNLQKSKWITAYGNSFYMSGSGYSTRKYYSSNGTCYNYTDGKWVQVKNSYCTLQDNKVYYFNSSGIRITASGWRNIGNNTFLYICSNGYVTGKMQKSGILWRYYIYSYTSKTWIQQKSKWVTISGNSYYINSSGYSGRAYYSASRMCYNYSNGSWVLFKNNICTLQDGNVYYFNASGVRVSKAGTYTTASGVKVATDATGKVTQTFTKTYQYVTIDLGDGKTTTVYGYYDEEMAAELVKLLNEYRAEQGVGALTVSTSLAQSAKTRAAEISYSFSHDRPNGTSCFSASSEMFAENIAAGYGSAEAIMTGWKNSSGHNANMLNSSYSTIGISVFVAESGDNEGYRIYSVQNFGY